MHSVLANTSRASGHANLRLRNRSTVYGLATIDDRGRVADRVVISALGWVPGTRLDIRERGGLILVRADRAAVFAVTGQGHVRLPAAVRHRCGLVAGDRTLLVADPSERVLVLHPPTALDAMVSQLPPLLDCACDLPRELAGLHEHDGDEGERRLSDDRVDRLRHAR